jgi:hypothetical protein
MFRVEIETANAAFVEQPGEELAAMLRDVAERVREALGYAPDTAHYSGILRDSNGNTVGRWDYTAD